MQVFCKPNLEIYNIGSESENGPSIILNTLFHLKDPYHSVDIFRKEATMIHTILTAYHPVIRMLGKVKDTEGKKRWFSYVHIVHLNQSRLLFNTLTRELLMCEENEIENEETRQYLLTHWFLVPEETNDTLIVNQVKSLMSLLRNDDRKLSFFDIYTTTDCNAHCFYCFEKGIKKQNMTMETAERVADFILESSQDGKVKLQWFGGEPLYNIEVIDHVTDKLARRGKDFYSVMISNGFLFDDKIIERAAAQWNLKRVQITLDGTEQVYNRIKAYIYKNINAYRVVRENIEKLMTAGIYVNVRLNIDKHNYKDLIRLADELKDEYKDRKNINVYCHFLWESASSDPHSAAVRKENYAAYEKLKKVLTDYGLSKPVRLKRELPINHCMADSCKSVVIFPDGQTGLCEHYMQESIVGDIWSTTENTDTVSKWRNERFHTELCDECTLYPQCNLLANCPIDKCFPEYKTERVRRMEDSMMYEYDLWTKTKQEDNRFETDDEEIEY